MLDWFLKPQMGNGQKNNAEVASHVVRYFVSIQKHSLMEVPLLRGGEAAACATALADLRAHHHPAFGCLWRCL